LPDFFSAYGQNPGKNGQNGCISKRLWPKLQNILTVVISIFIGVSNSLEVSIFLPKNVVLPKNKFLP